MPLASINDPVVSCIGQIELGGRIPRATYSPGDWGMNFSDVASFVAGASESVMADVFETRLLTLDETTLTDAVRAEFPRDPGAVRFIVTVGPVPGSSEAVWTRTATFDPDGVTVHPPVPPEDTYAEPGGRKTQALIALAVNVPTFPMVNAYEY